jgi:hypothetical protein
MGKKKLSLRDKFAMAAMNSILLNTAIADKKLAFLQRKYWFEQYGNITEFEAVAKESYLMADAMIKERM